MRAFATGLGCRATREWFTGYPLDRPIDQLVISGQSSNSPHWQYFARRLDKWASARATLALESIHGKRRSFT